MSEIIMDAQAVLNCLPHRYPFLLIDRVIAFEPNKSLVAIKNVTINEPFFTGHFPGKPVMPGVLILEALAQAGAILGIKSANMGPDDKRIFYFAGADNARFRRIVVPGDQLRLEVEILKVKGDFWKMGGSAYVGDELACSGEVLSACRE